MSENTAGTAETIKRISAHMGGLDNRTLTASIVGDYVRNNTLAPEQIPGLMQAIHTQLTAFGPGEIAGITREQIAQGLNTQIAGRSADPFVEGETRRPEPPETPEITQPTAAEIKASVTPDRIRSFVDGREYVTLRRHLKSHGMTPQEYKARYGLPADYPMTATNYAEQRRTMALRQGLGGNPPAPPAPTRTNRSRKAADAAAQTAPQKAPPNNRRSQQGSAQTAARGGGRGRKSPAHAGA